ncbi:MAG TPA: hypothetical protein VE988_28635 [Gemmataceae bacterium]|nr:hypothetical protein [Gemmataceae bacterium]
MDIEKCRALKEKLADIPEPQIVSAAEFFNGNDDLGSIGCNLISHPGVEAFRTTLMGLLARPDVEAVYAQISELDPGDECWPFTDAILVVGRISGTDLRNAVKALHPDEVGTAQDFGISSTIGEKHRAPVAVIWWD